MKAALEPITMTDAPACRCLRLAWTRLSTPTKSTSTASAKAWAGSPAVSGQMPALATTTSRCPNSATPSSIAVARASRSRTSAIAVNARCPSFSTSRAVSSRSSGRASGYSLVSMSAHKSTAMMSAPSAASIRACERPCPRAAPLTTATLPVTLPIADPFSCAAHEKGSAMGRVTGKVAVVSGAARGQGRSHARMLAAEGADIIAVDLCEDIETNEYPLARPEDLDETARLVEKEGQRVFTEIADVRDRAALSAAIDRGVAELGHLDIVVANAGICPLTAGLPAQAFADAVDVDLVGVLNLVHASLKHLQAGASVIVIGSNAAFMSSLNTSGVDGGTGGAGYAFAKLAAAHYVNDFALALAKFSIRMNAVHPTNVNTDMLHSPPMYRAFRPDLKNPTRQDAEPVFPLVQAMPVPYVEPEDISEAVLFLASDAARYITGQQLRVDAGGFLKVKPWSGA